jgi:hypothetical protein
LEGLPFELAGHMLRAQTRDKQLRRVRILAATHLRDPIPELSLLTTTYIQKCWRPEAPMDAEGEHSANASTFTWSGPRGVDGYTEAHACASGSAGQFRRFRAWMDAGDVREN